MSKPERVVNRIKETARNNGEPDVRKPVAIPVEALQEIRILCTQIDEMQRHLNAYVTGLRIGLGLKGQYLMDAAKGEFVPLVKNESAEKRG